MEIIVVGVSHRTAPVAVREHLAITPDQLEEALAGLRRRAPESMLLSTCNRTEIYAAVPSAQAGAQDMIAFLAELHGADLRRFAPHLYTLSGKRAVRHLFAVAAGLDSMILGEPQILGQVRQAFAAAASGANTGPLLSWACLHALKVGKRVRTDSDLAAGMSSVSHAAVELARSHYGNLAGRRSLLVGAGRMGELAARELVSSSAILTVANRDLERAGELATRLGGEAAGLDLLPELLVWADLAITSTSAQAFVLTGGTVREAAARRGGRPLLLIDIAVPRNVDPEVGRIDGISLWDIDALQPSHEPGLEEGWVEIARAWAIIEAELEQFDLWWHGLPAVPTIKAMRDWAEGIREAELRKALGRLGDLSEHQRSVVEGLASGIVNKMLHEPTVRLKSSSDAWDRDAYAAVLRELFGLGCGGQGAGASEEK